MDGFRRQGVQSSLRSLLSHRIQLYTLVSLIAVSVVVLNALRNFSNFYSVVIYLSKSGRSVLVRGSQQHL
jgi:E3 ubiquitin-protein ligase synoviolin